MSRAGTPLTHAIVFAMACVLAPVVASAQSSQSPPPARGTTTSATVTSVQVQREDIFDRSDSASWIARGANVLHVVTKPKIVDRELLIREGQPYDSVTAAETARNLRKLGIFRAVSVDSVRDSSGVVERVTTRDSWTTQPYVSFKSTGDQVTWGVGIAEKNLLGYQTKISLRYTKDPDRSTTNVEVNVPRVLWNRVGFTGVTNQLSDGRNARVTISSPFLSLSSPWSLTFDGRSNDEDVLRFFEGEEVASDTARHTLTKANLNGAWAARASPLGFVRFGGTLQLRHEDYAKKQSPVETPSFFGEFEISADLLRSDFLVAREFRSLGPEEDVDLSPTLHAGVWFAPKAWGYERGGVGPNVTAHAGWQIPYGFTTFDLRGSGLFNSTGLDSGSVVTQVTTALRLVPRHSVIANVSGGMQKNGYPGEEFDMGMSFGPRAYPLHGFTGDRAFLTSAEYRWVAIPDVLKLGLFTAGLGVFADYGGAWYDGSPKRTGKDWGVGLRLGSIRAASGKGATRIDLARRYANDAVTSQWVISIGSGFTFEKLVK
jgi:hypothetical protein